MVISGGCLGDIRGINEEIHASGIWEIYSVISAWVVQPRGPLDQIWRVWYSWKFQHERISEYICIKYILPTNVQIYWYSKFDMNQYINEHSHWKLYEYMNIFEYLTRLLHTHKRMSDYIHTEKLIRTNVRINICDQYIWIFKYIRHTLPKTYSCYTIKLWPKLGLILFMHKNIR